MITLTSQEIVEFKPHIEKTANLVRDPNRLDDYIIAGIKYVDNEMIINNIDLDDTFLTDNQSYENVYLQYIYYLYLESCHINRPSSEDLQLLEKEYNRYTEFFSKFKILWDNEKNDDNEVDKNLNNNITLKFG